MTAVPGSAISAEQVLADLNPEQREAAQAVIGPVVILAGAGTGKTRVISHRVAYAVATGAVDERQVLVVSFTTKAAREMEGRLRALGLRQATANTLHAAALAQLRHFWPEVHGRELPPLMESKLPLVRPLARGLPGNYRFTPAKDLADEIEWAKNRRIEPAAPPDPVAERDQGVFTRLAEWRRDRARRDSVPAYVVAHDATLRAIAAARPANATELAAVPGMGAVKVDRYGDEISEIIRRS